MINGAGADARARAIVASLDSLSSEGVFAAFEELDALPPDAVVAALAAATGPMPDVEKLDDATRRALGLPLRPLRLATRSIVRDADLFDLGAVAEEQLRIAGRFWDGRDLAAEERLDGEVEGSFAGTLEHRVIGEVEAPSAPPLFDVLLYAGDAGAVFRAGTTELVGAISGTTVEMRDQRARMALQEALGLGRAQPAVAPAIEEADEAVVEAAKPKAGGRAPKKAAAKKSATAKKAAAAPKKAAAEKKTSAKKATAKKSATNAGAKKSTAKKKAAEEE